MGDHPASTVLRLTLPDAEQAAIIATVMGVDQELTDASTRSFEVQGRTVTVTLTAESLKILRLTTNSFLDYLTVSAQCLEQLDPVA